MNKTQFLKQLEIEIADRCAWCDDPSEKIPGNTKLQTFIEYTDTTIRTTKNLVSIESASFIAAWRAVGGKGKPTYKSLRALPEGEMK